MAIRRLAASLILGCILSVCCPVNSAADTCIFKDLNTGMRERETKIIPAPPSHCVRLLQKRIPFGMVSTSGRMDAPVVVNPDIDSKNASPKLVIEPLIRKGRVPKRLKRSQIPVTTVSYTHLRAHET